MVFHQIKHIQFSNSESSALNYIMANLKTVTYMSIRDLSNEAHVSPSTIGRLVKKMGYSGFPEFKIALQNEIKQSGLSKEDIFQDIAEIISPEIFPVNLSEKIEEIAKLIIKAPSLCCFGMGSSAISAEYARLELSIMECPVYFTNEPYSPMLFNTANKQNIVLIFSVSGETIELVELCRKLIQTGTTVISITNGNNNTLSNYSKINLPYYSKVVSVKPGIDFSTQLPTIFIVESLAKKIYELKKQNKIK